VSSTKTAAADCSTISPIAGVALAATDPGTADGSGPGVSTSSSSLSSLFAARARKGFMHSRIINTNSTVSCRGRGEDLAGGCGGCGGGVGVGRRCIGDALVCGVRMLCCYFVGRPNVAGWGLRSSTSQLNVSTFCETLGVV